MKKLIDYLKGSRAELAKVTWPSRQTTIKHTGVVIIISVLVALFLGGIDYLLNKILELFI